jgi:hypothetical protein
LRLVKPALPYLGQLGGVIGEELPRKLGPNGSRTVGVYLMPLFVHGGKGVASGDEWIHVDVWDTRHGEETALKSLIIFGEGGTDHAPPTTLGFC